MKRVAVATLATMLALVSPHRASAWEVDCRVPPGAGAGPTPVETVALESSICGTTAAASCQEGYGFARGTQLGEHTWLTKDAMFNAGLGAFATGSIVFEAPVFGGTAPVFGYYTDVTPVQGVPGFSLVPAGPGLALNFATREVALPELAELPDGSHSIADYIMGNEHCIPLNVPRTTPREIEMCHSFEGHMGAVNSTHWPPLNKAMYDRYHQMALSIAQRCVAMQMATIPGHPLAPHMTDLVAACEREALAFEAMGTHYSEDTWATGHMFKRWGSPEFRATVPEQLQNSMAAMTTGIIHGARALTNFHDQANMPGPPEYYEGTKKDHVRYVDPSGRHEGGGDLYLLQCTAEAARNKEKGWFVAGAPALSSQFKTMRSCLSAGFQEVYNAGPKTAGAIQPNPVLDGTITSSADPKCWDHWLTNRSMMNALGAKVPVPGWRSNFTDGVLRATDISPSPTSLAKGVLKESFATAADVRALPTLPAEETRLRVTLVRLAAWYIQRGKAAPNGTDLAQMTVPGLPGAPQIAMKYVFGAPGALPSEDFLGTLLNDAIAHLVPSDPTAWTTELATPTACTTDADCVGAPGTYCDRGVAEGDTLVRRCVPQETAVLRAFRAAETPRWCELESWDSLNAARRLCQNSGAGTLPCDACVQLIIPRLRNACDPSGPEVSSMPAPGALDGRAICDIYYDAGVVTRRVEEEFVHVPYEIEAGETFETATLRVALEQCLEGPKERVSRVGSTYESSPDEATTTTITMFQPGVMHSEITCAREGGVHWDRIIHPASSPSGTVEITLTPTELGGYPFTSPANDMELTVFRGADCGEQLSQVRGDTLPPGATSLTTFWVVNNGVPDEICIRVRALRDTVRTGHVLTVSRQ